MTNQELIDKMTQEGYYQQNVISITSLFLENGFCISKIYEGFITLKREYSESLELLNCFSSSCKYIAHSMNGNTIGIILTQPTQIKFLD